MGFCSGIGGRVHASIGKIGSDIGAFNARNPWRVLLGSLFLALMVGQQYRVVPKESRSDRLWVPSGTKQLDDQDQFTSLFSQNKIRIETIMLEPAVSGANMLTKANLIAAAQVFGNITALSVTVDGQAHNYTSLCQTRGGACMMTGALNAWGTDSISIMNGIVAETDDQSLRATLKARYPNQDELEAIVADPQFTNNDLASGIALRITLFLKNQQVFNAKTGRNEDKPAEEWEKAMLDYLLARTTSNAVPDTLKVSVQSERSFSDEFGEVIRGDLKLIGIALAIMVMYLVINLGRCRMSCCTHAPCGESRVGLSMLGVAATGLGITFSYGLASIFGIFFGPVHQVLPFILLGLGVDDCFVIYGAFNQPDVSNLPPDRRMAVAMSRAGASIAVTSFTDFLAFMIGSTSRLPALSSFCQYAALGVLCIFFMQITFFSAAIVLDERRRTQRRVDLCCCFHCGENKVCACGSNPSADGTKATTANPPSTISRFLGDRLAPLIAKRVWPILALSAIIFAFLAWESSKMEVEDRQTDFFPSDSYVVQTLKKQAAYFCKSGERVYIVSLSTDGSATSQQALGAIFPALNETRQTQAPYIKNPTNYPDRTYHWYDTFKSQYLPSIAVPPSSYDSATGIVASKAEFFQQVRNFLDHPTGQRFRDDVRWKDETRPEQGILASRAHTEHMSFDTCSGGKKTGHDIERQVQSMIDLDQLVGSGQNMQNGNFAFSFEYPRWEGLRVIRAELVQNVALALAAVLVVCVIMIADVFAASLVGLCVLLTVIELLGAMHLWGLAIDTVSVINLVLAVGLSVDYAAHIAHCFMSKQGEAGERIAVAMAEIGAPVLNGAMSTFLAVLLLAFSKSYVFVVLFRQFLLTCLFGVFNGIVTLPALLVLCAPTPHKELDNVVGPANTVEIDEGNAAASAAPPSSEELVPKGTKRTV